MIILKKKINELDLELCKQYNSYEWRKSELANAINANVLPTNFDEKLFLSKRAGNLKVIIHKEVSVYILRKRIF